MIARSEPCSRVDLHQGVNPDRSLGPGEAHTESAAADDGRTVPVAPPQLVGLIRRTEDCRMSKSAHRGHRIPGLAIVTEPQAGDESARPSLGPAIHGRHTGPPRQLVTRNRVGGHNSARAAWATIAH